MKGEQKESASRPRIGKARRPIGFLLLLAVGLGLSFLILSKKPVMTTNDTNNLKTLHVSRCNFSLQYPSHWSLVQQGAMSSDTPETDYYYACDDITAPDYQIPNNPDYAYFASRSRSDQKTSAFLSMTRTKLGAKYKDTAINTIADFIQTFQAQMDMPEKTASQEGKVYGNVKGTFFTTSTMHVFLVEEKGYIYTFAWPAINNDQYIKELEQVLTTIQFDIDTSTWQTYTDEKGYVLKYPTDWETYRKSPYGGPTFHPRGLASSYSFSIIGPSQAESMKKPENAISTETIVLGGYTGVKKVYDFYTSDKSISGVSGQHILQTFIEANDIRLASGGTGKIIIIASAEEEQHKKYSDIFMTILSTFRFTY